AMAEPGREDYRIVADEWPDAVPTWDQAWDHLRAYGVEELHAFLRVLEFDYNEALRQTARMEEDGDGMDDWPEGLRREYLRWRDRELRCGVQLTECYALIRYRLEHRLPPGEPPPESSALTSSERAARQAEADTQAKAPNARTRR